MCCSGRSLCGFEPLWEFRKSSNVETCPSSQRHVALHKYPAITGEFSGRARLIMTLHCSSVFIISEPVWSLKTRKLKVIRWIEVAQMAQSSWAIICYDWHWNVGGWWRLGEDAGESEMKIKLTRMQTIYQVIFTPSDLRSYPTRRINLMVTRGSLRNASEFD